MVVMSAPANGQQVSRQSWGEIAGGLVDLYTVRCENSDIRLTNYGARLVAFDVPDAKGATGNIVLTADQPSSYKGMMSLAGATVGRYANRIARGELPIHGEVIHLAVNNGGNLLHGGRDGFQTRLWTGKPVPHGVEFTLVSADGDMGFPGAMTVSVTYTLSCSRTAASVQIAYKADTTKTTAVNLTNHSFFNLMADPAQSVMKDEFTVDADSYLPTDAHGIPTGDLAPVSKTPLDFRTRRLLGDSAPSGGYDTTLVLRSHAFRQPVARVHDSASGRTLTVQTTEPAIQLFALPDTTATAAGESRPSARAAFCLETQHYPDSPNHSDFPSTLLEPGATFHSKTVYSVDWKRE
jgi:aldose 1-epimerase